MSRPRYFADNADRSSGLELFFDLVFVLCIAQLARVLRDEPDWHTAAVVVALSVPIWWAWTGITFCTDRFPADDAAHRALVLLAAAATGVLALGVPEVRDTGGAEFAVGYATMRLVLVVLYLRAAAAVPERAEQPRWYAAGFAGTVVLWFASIAIPTPERWLVWAVAMVIDVAVPAVIDRRIGLLPVDVRHLPERFGAFVIIVLGETVTTTAVLAVEPGPMTPAAGVALAEAFLLAAALWWGFFDRDAWRRRFSRLAGDRSGRLANIVCAYLHFPLIAGIVLVAVGSQLAVTGARGAPVTLLLTGGCATYLLTLDAMTLVLGIPRAESLVRVRLALVAVLGLLAAVGRGWPSTVVAGGCLVVLLGHVAANLWRSHRRPVADEEP